MENELWLANDYGLVLYTKKPQPLKRPRKDFRYSFRQDGLLKINGVTAYLNMNSNLVALIKESCGFPLEGEAFPIRIVRM